MRESLDSRALCAVSDAVLTIAAERSFEPVLKKLADAARELADARYAAIGVPDGEGGFANFITSGMTDKQWEAIGELPRQHGLLGAMLADPAPYRAPDISKEPRFEGWPDAHPHMRSFLGVPIVSKAEVVGAFYLTDRPPHRLRRRPVRAGNRSGPRAARARTRPHDPAAKPHQAQGRRRRHTGSSRPALPPPGGP